MTEAADGDRYDPAAGQPGRGFDLAGAYAFGIAGNHPFNDGNKRTGWSACRVFLRRNGVTLRASAVDAVLNMVRLVQKRIDEREFAAWLRTQALP